MKLLFAATLVLSVSLLTEANSKPEWNIKNLLLKIHIPGFSKENLTAKAPKLVATANDEDWQAPTLYTSMKIGTPGVTFKLQVDQYFEDALLVGPQCASISCKGIEKNRTIYNPSKSSTSKDVGDPARAYYGSSVTGEYYTDDVTVDGISAKQVGFAVLKQASSRFYKVPVDGVFGMSFLGNTRGKKGLASPVNAILSTASKKTIQLWFNKAKKNADRYGTLTFGKNNSDKCNADTQWSPVTNDDFTFTVQKVRSDVFAAHRELPARIDPQSQFIGLPTTIYKDLVRVIGDSSGSSSQFSCENVKGVTLDVKIGGQYFKLKAEDFTATVPSSSSYCKLLVQDVGDEFDTGYTLGEPFFRRYCITYDLAQQKIGFSTIKN